MDTKEVLIIKTSYTDAQKRATAKYRSNNKEKVNEQRKKYYQTRKASDPHFLEYKRTKAKEYYYRKKSSKESKEPEEPKQSEEPKQPIEEPVEETKKVEFVEVPILDETKEEKKQRRGKKGDKGGKDAKPKK